jgi:hypothetical protein
MEYTGRSLIVDGYAVLLLVLLISLFWIVREHIRMEEHGDAFMMM